MPQLVVSRRHQLAESTDPNQFGLYVSATAIYDGQWESPAAVLVQQPNGSGGGVVRFEVGNADGKVSGLIYAEF